MAFVQADGCECIAFVLAGKFSCAIAVVIISYMAQETAVMNPMLCNVCISVIILHYLFLHRVVS